MRSFKEYFRRSLEADPGRLHFAAHSHHLWPDVTLEAQRAAWELAAHRSDLKWDAIFGEVLPETRSHVARTLGTADPGDVALAPNVHELFVRLLSTFPPDRPTRILSTDGEFHSFTRQVARLEEDELCEVTRVPTQPFDTFQQRFEDAVDAGSYDLVYLSHVFFDSGFVVPDLDRIVAATADETTVFVDGYHAFMALPLDLAALERRVFYGAGGYKYAMAGEGVCFAHCPKGWAERPRNTGWYATFGELSSWRGEGVAYSSDGSRMMGATFDPTPHFRFNAAMSLWQQLGVTPRDIHERVRTLHGLFLEGLDARGSALRGDQLLPAEPAPDRGHFLTFQTPAAERVEAHLQDRGVVCDRRGDRLRLGFGIYHDPSDVEELLERLPEA